MAICSEQELAMDVLQVTSNPIVGQKFGTSAANSCISTSALAITSMVLKADYKMFFGDDTSTYVSLFCDMADTIVKMADPEFNQGIFFWMLQGFELLRNFTSHSWDKVYAQHLVFFS